MSNLDTKSSHKKGYVWSFKSVVIWVLMALLIVVFVFSFMMEEIVDTSRSGGAVGSIDHKKIMMTRGSDFYDYYSRIMEQYGSQGPQLESFAKAAAFNAVVDNYILVQAALKNHLYVFNEELLDNLQAGLSKEGVSLEAYKNYVVSDRQRIEAHMKNSLLSQKVEDTFFRVFPVSQSDLIFEERLKSFGKKMKVVYWRFDNDYSSIINEEKLKKYYEANSKRYEKYGLFNEAKSFVEADYINENEQALQDLIFEKIRGDFEKKKNLSLEEIAKEMKAEVLNTKLVKTDSEKLDFIEPAKSLSGVGPDKILDLIQIPLHRRSDLIRTSDGAILVEIAGQEIEPMKNEKVVVNERDIDRAAKELFEQYKLFLKSKHTIKRNF